MSDKYDMDIKMKNQTKLNLINLDVKNIKIENLFKNKQKPFIHKQSLKKKSLNIALDILAVFSIAFATSFSLR